VRGPHALHGELKVDPLTDRPERFQPGTTINIGERVYTVRSAHMHQKTLLLALEGIDSRTAADELRSLLIEVPEEELPELGPGEHYRYQLLGIEVFGAAGEPLGRIEDVIDTGANDVYAVRNAEGELLVPAIDTVVKQVDVAAGRMTVDVPPGLERRPPEKPRRPRR
jgi:16S rRNA processing protein RimM